MSTAVIHIVHKLNLLIEAPDDRQARDLYANASRLLQEQVLPRLELMLQAMDKDTAHYLLNSLDVDLELPQNTSLQEVLPQQLADRIAQQLRQKLEPVPGSRKSDGELLVKRSDAEQLTAAFLYFLEKGVLPWWFTNSKALLDNDGLINAIATDEASFVVLLRNLLNRHPVSLERLVWQSVPSLLAYLFSLVVPSLVFGKVQALLAEIETVFKENKAIYTGIAPGRVFWMQAWTAYADMPSTAMDDPEAFTRNIKAMLLSDPGHMELQSFRPEITFNILKGSQQDTPVPEAVVPEAEAEQWLQHAGLIILHPFLQYFFLELGLLEGAHFKDSSSVHIAIHLLHFLATGQEGAPDYDLLMEKYLCGVGPGEITDRFIILEEKMKAEAMGLLDSVIHHWAVLKSTTAAGLREGFLQRKGKLVLNNGNHKLILESTAMDILLGQLPWNISLIKLPWLKPLLHVEWSS